jgi:hypothetical protein
MPLTYTTVNVPAIYEIRGILPRKRNATNIGIDAVFAINIAKADKADLAPAFDINSFDDQEKRIFSVQGNLFTKSTRFVAEQFLNPTGLYGCAFYEVGRHSNKANWPKGDNTYRSFSVGYAGLIAESKVDELKLRERICDNKANIAEVLQEFADDFLIVGDELYVKVGEPYYVVSTLGLGRDHGGTLIYVNFCTKEDLLHSGASVFSALDFDKAHNYAQKVASERGDSRVSILRRIHTHNPDLVTISRDYFDVEDWNGFDVIALDKPCTFYEAMLALRKINASQGLSSKWVIPDDQTLRALALINPARKVFWSVSSDDNESASLNCVNFQTAGFVSSSKWALNHACFVRSGDLLGIGRAGQVVSIDKALKS